MSSEETSAGRRAHSSKAASRRRLGRLGELYATPTGRRMIRYTIVSAFNVVFSFTVLGIVYGVLRLWSEVPSTLFANVLGVLPAYYLTRNWAWGKSGRSHLVKEVVPFWTATLVGIALSVLAASEARHLGVTHHLDHEARTLLVLAANLLAFGVLWVLKFFAFNGIFRAAPTEAGEPGELAEA